MRTACLTFSLLLAAALAACGGGDSDKGSDGAGGSGGSGGQTVQCGGARVLDLDGSESPAVLTDTLGPTDAMTGTCNPADATGNEVAVRYKAAEAGMYRFSTEGTDFNTYLYVREECADAFSETACNDDAGDTHSEVMLELDAGQEVFVFVDSVGVDTAEPFTLTATHIVADPPMVDTFDAYANMDHPSVGAKVTGRNPDSPITAVGLFLIDPNGNSLTGDNPWVFAPGDGFLELNQNGGTFDATLSVTFNTNGQAIEVAELAIVFLDENQLVSELARADTQAPPELAHGDPCDANEALNICGPDDTCAAREPETEFTCSTATAPVLLDAVATRNLADGNWGLVVTGTDPEADVNLVSVLPKDADGEDLPILQGGAVFTGFYQLGFAENGDFRGVAVLPARFDAVCVPPAQASYDDCLEAGVKSDQACLDDALALLDQCEIDTLGQVATVEVQVQDLSRRTSTTISVPMGETPSVELGGVCDARGATGICPADAYCWTADPFLPATCQADGPDCPVDFGAIDLNGHATAEGWAFNGDNSDAAAHGFASCGGGGPSDVFAFTAPSAGTYTMATSDLGAGVDTVLAVRRFCQIPEYELACGDDTDAGLASEISVDLAEGQLVYIVVDGVQNPTTGAFAVGDYTLTVTGP